jgi:hypothetical protein
MAHTRKDEARALDAEEHALVEKSHHPEVKDLSQVELTDLLKLIRERRDRAQRLARQKRRELRGKAAPRGATAATGEAGSKRKLEVLAMAVRRLNAERDRRRRQSGREDLQANAEKALAMRKAAAEKRHHPIGRTANRGMASNPSSRREQITDPREVGRVSQSIKRAQAKRDS